MVVRVFGASGNRSVGVTPLPSTDINPVGHRAVLRDLVAGLFRYKSGRRLGIRTLSAREIHSERQLGSENRRDCLLQTRAGGASPLEEKAKAAHAGYFLVTSFWLAVVQGIKHSVAAKPK